MCGIYGFIGKSTNHTKVLEIMESLGIESEVRGIHATGYYGLNSVPISAKAPMKATNFFKTLAWQDLYVTSPLTILVGHNRWATNGDPQDNENNHPFTTNRFGFVHNGVVSSVKPDMDITCRSKCDSEKIFRYFLKRFYNDHNTFHSIEKTMKVFDKGGDYACALVDAKERLLYLFRNDGRPMNYIKVESLGVIFYASTSDIIKNAFLINGIKFDSSKCYSLKCGQILRIDENLEKHSEFVAIEKPTKIIKYYIPSTSSFPKSYHFPKAKNTNNWYECKKCKKQFLNAQYAKKHIEDEHKIVDVEKIENLIVAPGGGTVTFTQKPVQTSLLNKLTSWMDG